MQGLRCGNEAVHETRVRMLGCQRTCRTLSADTETTCPMHSLGDSCLSSLMRSPDSSSASPVMPRLRHSCQAQ